ncbi:cytochrome c biogenesis protein CcdA [Synechococcus sp. ROS8604]|uniref:cytochrome c biogenesis protein CcdA n=1 Tax=Synechococcus sp. ROS8604 TaxID=1442557 RepID=UPI0021048AAB|nr:cytochrome c biogenesis protein CcdA [Synechococcus sp. ROS8604]
MCPGLLPVQLSYLGAQKQQRPNPGKVIQFSLGVVSAYSILGLFTSLAGALIIDHRGGLLMAAGVIVIAMALQLKGWGLRFPWHRLTLGAIGAPRWIKRLPIGAFLIGFTFALVTSPCASPVLAAVLSAAAASGSPPLATAAMVLYAVGYTMVILLAGLGVELGGLRRQLLERDEQISGISAIVLLTFGMIYLWTGFQDLQQQAQM